MNEWARPFNLGQISVPAAVIRPKDANEVASIVKCALKHNKKVQAKAGGHSFANHGMGGEDGAISVDLHHLQYVSVNSVDPSQSIRVGGGTRLGQIDEQLRPYERAIPHGACYGIGIGGHATVGGLGSMSRMWGTTLDHVEEVEVVTANGTIVRANGRQNSDLFFALRGAGASFGIVTEFVMRTQRTPREVLHYSHDLQFKQFNDLVDVYFDWQTLIADPRLDPRFGSAFFFTSDGARISTMWYGTEEDMRQSGILDKLPSTGAKISVHQGDWEFSLAMNAEVESRHIPNVSNNLYSKGLGFTQADLLPKKAIADLFELLESQHQGSGPWSIKFEAAGGAISKTPLTATAYAHRDKFMFYQSYSTDNMVTRNLLEKYHRRMLNSLPSNTPSTYPGFADPELRDPQRMYWGANLCTLEEIKTTWDPLDVFHNPQSVRLKSP
ncbi:berberine bridge enzyme [Colletotrichum truncatum]|uniref:Berberine bridge enzyme n=1 Tax=Colletotrichum truncatum TaxID=5467 RepID=A0ACC3ZD09_COLTU|nr:berberine bridge enzyme [Colletotrichum truncatum]KAF6797951.1 berberine bridge enzyme [Colletotrichum truncatum]